MTTDELLRIMNEQEEIYNIAKHLEDCLKTANSRDRKIIENELCKLEILAKKKIRAVDTELYKRNIEWWEV